MSIDVGLRLQAIRKMNGWSQRELAKRAGVTNSTISVIEQDRVSPSVNSLKKVLDGIPMSLADFFNLDFEEAPQVFYTAAEMPNVGHDRIVAKLLGSNKRNRTMSIIHTCYPPGADTGEETLAHEGEEGGIVVEGELEITVGKETKMLNAGDGYYIDSRRPHRLRNVGRVDCVVVVSKTPAII